MKPTDKRFLSAKEAANRLGVGRSTLYAYVSRGMIRSEGGDGSRRERRYSAEDIDRLLAKKTAARSPEKLAEGALHWGLPVLDSAVTLIQDGWLYYRGQDVVRLAEEATFEQVVTLLWGGQPTTARAMFGARQTGTFAQVQASAEAMVETPLVAGLQRSGLSDLARLHVALAAVDDPTAYDLSVEAVRRTGWRILRLMTLTVGGQPGADGERRMAEALAVGWGWDTGDLKAVRILERALILCADHELNASSFAARVVASAEASPYAVVQAGLAALSGVKHGGQAERVGRLLTELEAAPSAAALVGEWLRRGETIPGFGHPLYPQGDPRAGSLLDAIAFSRVSYKNRLFGLVSELLQVMEARGEEPTLDLALATAERVMGLRRGAALTLFALGRTAGWIAHALEQYTDGRLLRPRARYVGERPDDGY